MTALSNKHYSGPYKATEVEANQSVELVEFNVPLDTYRNRSFRRRVFPANHLAMVLTKQTYNNQDNTRNPRYTYETQKTKPNKTKLTVV